MGIGGEWEIREVRGQPGMSKKPGSGCWSWKMKASPISKRVKMYKDGEAGGEK